MTKNMESQVKWSIFLRRDDLHWSFFSVEGPFSGVMVEFRSNSDGATGPMIGSGF